MPFRYIARKSTRCKGLYVDGNKFSSTDSWLLTLSVKKTQQIEYKLFPCESKVADGILCEIFLHLISPVVK